MAMVWRVPRAITPGLVLVQPTYLDSAQTLVPCASQPSVGVATAAPAQRAPTTRPGVARSQKLQVWLSLW